MGAIKADRTVDVSGQVCPQPILAAQRAVKTMRKGELLELISTDIASRTDIPAWCERTGNELVEKADDGKIFRYFIRKQRDARQQRDARH